MGDHVFFYGTLMAPFNRPGRQRVTPKLTFKGRGTIRAALFDLGIYPAAVPAEDDSAVWGEVYETSDTAAVLAVLDEIEGYGRMSPTAACIRASGRRHARRWASRKGVDLFLQRAARARAAHPSGDYLEHHVR